MSILADIAEMEDRINELLEDLPIRSSNYEDELVDAIFEVLDEHDVAGLDELELEDIIADALSDVFADLDQDTRDAISERVQESVSQTRAFYEAQGIRIPGLREAVRRSDTAQRLSRFLEDGMAKISANLRKGTIEVLQEMVARGDVSRSEMEEKLIERADAAANHARTQARTSVSAYNQNYREELADRAELEHFLYYGNIQDNSRQFCRRLVDGVYTRQQIDQMKNGMLEPVMTFQGGYNCRHSWVPVDPEWDPELRDMVVESDTPLTLTLPSDRTITVFE